MVQWEWFCAELQRGADSSGLRELLGMQTRLGMPGAGAGESKCPFSLEQEWLQEGESIAVDFPGKR